MVVSKLLEHFTPAVELVVCPTAREADGLAMSSRNLRLTEAQRQVAGTIYQSLLYIKDRLSLGDITPLKKEAVNMLAAKGFRTEYVEIADASTLEAVDNWNGKQALVALAAAFLGEIRLIDNIVLT
jgi:pantoate--beta-alanine ligase